VTVIAPQVLSYSLTIFVDLGFERDVLVTKQLDVRTPFPFQHRVTLVRRSALRGAASPGTSSGVEEHRFDLRSNLLDIFQYAASMAASSVWQLLSM
jgi:hypothetical protein